MTETNVHRARGAVLPDRKNLGCAPTSFTQQEPRSAAHEYEADVSDCPLSGMACNRRVHAVKCNEIIAHAFDESCSHSGPSGGGRGQVSAGESEQVLHLKDLSTEKSKN